LIQRKTQTLAYWQKQFSVSRQDIEFIYHQILEEHRLFTFDNIVVMVIRRHCEMEELESRAELQQGELYQPKENYTVDEKVVFPIMEYALGTVKYIREANHPDYGAFSVMGVAFENGHTTREFATGFAHDHALNANEQSLTQLQGMMSPEEIYQAYHATIQPKVKAALEASDEFIEFHGQYFLRDLLTDFHEGLFNIADAAIDINNGPLSVDALIEQMGLTSKGEDLTDIRRFSVSYRLANDERFNDVGPAGQSLWYLERLEPPEVRHIPRRLQVDDESYDVGALDDNLYALLTEIDDEATHPDDISAVGPDINEVTITLNYPHHRVGTLPLTPKTQSFFPVSYYNPVRFAFVDGRTGDTFPGWVVLAGKYVFGLDEWYKKNKLPVGAYVKIKRSKDPMQIIVDYQPTRLQRDWIRLAAAQGHRLTFQMNKEAINCKYDELMIVGERSQTEIDRLWLDAENKEISVYDLLCDIFPELSKLNPQSTVHAKTLYSAINIIRRASPGLVFQELAERECFIPMDHGYWVYDPSLRD
jgi:hypothetical protein